MKNLIISLLLLISFSTKADIFIDPYFGMNLNGSSETNGNESDISGFDMGARFGWMSMGLFIGVDYRYSSFSIDQGGDPKISATHWAGVLGYELPFFVRVYGEYIFTSDIEDDDGGTYDNSSGILFGFGLKLLPFLSVNLEMVDYTSESYTGSPSSSSDTNFDYYLLSASIPFTF